MNKVKENNKTKYLISNKDENEDKYLQDELKMLIKRLQESNPVLYLSALEEIRDVIRCSTKSITSVPKPLKYMKQYYEIFKETFKKLPNLKTRQICADIISVLSMVVMGMGQECICYKLLGDPVFDISEWGYEYVRYIAFEIPIIWQESNELCKEKLMNLIEHILPYMISHNAETEACDLLMEIDCMDLINDFIDINSYPKISLYLQNCVKFLPEGENILILQVLLKLSIRFNKHIDSIRFAFMLNDNKEIKKIFDSCQDLVLKKQLAFFIARQRCHNIEFSELSLELSEIISNTNLNRYFINLGRELDIMEPKSCNDVYKSNLSSTAQLSTIDSARNNLAASFVNGFVNTGFSTDKILHYNVNKWLYSNKEYGRLSTTATMGLLKLWDLDGGLSFIDLYLYSKNDYIKGGALLACGIINCGIRNEIEPGLALLSDYLIDDNEILQRSSILGIGIAYSGSNNELVLNLLRQLFKSDSNNYELKGIIALSVGLIGVGSCNSEDIEILLEIIIQIDKMKLKSYFLKFIFLGLGLLFLGRQNESKSLIANLRVLEEPYQSYAICIVEICSYAGTGNVLQIQKLLHICSEHYVKLDKKLSGTEDSANDESCIDIQMIAVIGIALIGMGDEIGTEMSIRSLGHLMRYGERNIRRTVPLAISLCSISNPKGNILDMLNKFAHDKSANQISYSSIFAMGLVGAGTNNSRLANILRKLAQYYKESPKHLFLVRIAQGLTHLGKGTLTLNPYQNGGILRPVSIAGLLCTLFASLDMNTMFFDSNHFLLFTLVPAIELRCLITFDEHLNHLQIPVRIGMSVDTVTQAGQPKTIIGFQTNTTPILLGAEEKAEMATDEYYSLSSIFEGFVILRKKNNN